MALAAVIGITYLQDTRSMHRGTNVVDAEFLQASKCNMCLGWLGRVSDMQCCT